MFFPCCSSTQTKRGTNPPVLEAGAIVTEDFVSANNLSCFFYSSEIDSSLFKRIKGKSYKEDCPIPVSELRYIRALHIDAEGRIHIGEMICNQQISNDIIDILQELFIVRYPIERMVLVDNYDADDDLSMEANNSSCFNYRTIAETDSISMHGYGLAVDINTKFNPYVKTVKGVRRVWPATSEQYLRDRDNRTDIPYLIKKGDACYNAFIKRGFVWGGEWVSKKDYQHFEKHEQVR